MSDKKSVVMRVPVELAIRINEYEKVLSSSGIKIGKADVMRNFANNAITPKDSLTSVFRRLDKK